MSVRHVERLVAAGSRIRADQAAKLRSAVRPVTLKDLGELAKIENTDERLGVIDALVSGYAKSAADGRRKWAAKDAPSVEGVGESTNETPAFAGLMKAWARAKTSDRKRFLLTMASEIWHDQNAGVPIAKWAEADDV